MVFPFLSLAVAKAGPVSRNARLELAKLSTNATANVFKNKLSCSIADMYLKMFPHMQ
jgi:hypothetical protein